MKRIAQVEIGFYNEKQAYISISVSSLSTFAKELQVLLLFSGYSLLQMYKIDPNHPVCNNLAIALINQYHKDINDSMSLYVAPANPSIFKPSSIKLIEVPIDEIKIVPKGDKADKKFTFGLDQQENGQIHHFFDFRGFGAIGKGINYYVPISIGILLKQLKNQYMADPSFVKFLSGAAEMCGTFIANKKIDSTNVWPIATDIAKEYFKGYMESLGREIHFRE